MMCPHGVDQTMRIEQKWQLIAPRIGQSISLTANGDVRGSNVLQNIFDPKNMFGAMEKLARPVRPSISEQLLTTPSTNEPAARKLFERSGIESLPVEMVLTILEIGDLSKADILSLALSSPSLQPIIMAYIQSSYVKAVAPWAGTPMACIGNYTLDLPASFMEDEVLAGKFQDWEKNTPAPGFVGGRTMPASRRGLPPSRKFFLDCAKFARPMGLRSEEKEWKDALKGIGEGGDALEHAIACPDLFPENTQWVLRNLTKKEYYIPQPFPGVTRKTWLKRLRRHDVDGVIVHVPETLGFDDVMLFRTWWTSIRHDDYGFKKGAWAGDCFDIVSSGVFAAEGNKEWRDVSVEVVEEAKRHWDAVTGA